MTQVTRSRVRPSQMFLPGLTNFIAVAAGEKHTCPLKSDTTVHYFGESGPWIGINSSSITYHPIFVRTGPDRHVRDPG